MHCCLQCSWTYCVQMNTAPPATSTTSGPRPQETTTSGRPCSRRRTLSAQTGQEKKKKTCAKKGHFCCPNGKFCCPNWHYNCPNGHFNENGQKVPKWVAILIRHYVRYVKPYNTKHGRAQNYWSSTIVNSLFISVFHVKCKFRSVWTMSS